MEDMIKNLAEMSVDEAYGAHKYAKLAYENKHHYPQMAEAVANMAMQELTHADTLMKSAKTILANMIDQEKSNLNTHTDCLVYLVDYLQDKMWNESAATKACLEQYKSL